MSSRAARAEWPRHAALVEAFKRLAKASDEHNPQHFYNMKSGLVGDVLGDAATSAGTKKWRYRNNPDRPLERVDLPEVYQRLDDADIEALRNGFGPQVASLFEDQGSVEPVTERDLQQAVGDAERAALALAVFEGA